MVEIFVVLAIAGGCLLWFYVRLLRWAFHGLVAFFQGPVGRDRQSGWDAVTSKEKGGKLTPEELRKRLSAQRFVSTPDTMNMTDRDGTPKAWILSDYEYPAQIAEDDGLRGTGLRGAQGSLL